VSFKTRLLREMNKGEKAREDKFEYHPQTDFLDQVYKDSKLVLADVSVYELKTQEELRNDWNATKNLFKKVNKHDVSKTLVDDCIGMVEFTVGPTNRAGNNTAALMTYLKNVYIIGPPTEMSKARPAIKTTEEKVNLLRRKYPEFSDSYEPTLFMETPNPWNAAHALPNHDSQLQLQPSASDADNQVISDEDLLAYTESNHSNSNSNGQGWQQPGDDVIPEQKPEEGGQVPEQTSMPNEPRLKKVKKIKT
jgi:hypothetical protein